MANKTYTVKASSGTCTDIALTNTVPVTVTPLPNSGLNVSIDNGTVCEGTMVTITVSNSETGVSYQLTDGTNNIGTAVAGTGGNITFTDTPSSTTTYTVDISSGSCTDINLTNTVSAVVNPLPDNSLIIAADFTTLCEGDEVQFTIRGSEYGVSYQLTDGVSFIGAPVVGTGSDIAITDMPLTTTTYEVEATGQNCANPVTLNMTITVVVDNAPTAVDDDFTVEGETMLDILANDVISSDVDINIVFHPSNGTVSIISDSIQYIPYDEFFGSDEFTYEICSQTCNTCTEGLVSIIVNEKETEIVLISKIITINGDGINDELRFSDIEKYPENELIIFNRWGNTIYHAKPYSNNWEPLYNGTSINGEKLPIGTYYYILKLDERKSVKGFFEILK